MKTTLRSLYGVVAGMALALVLVIGVELFSSVVHPFPPEFAGTMEEVCQHVARYPDWILAVVVLAWSATAFASAWVATRIGNQYSGTTVILSLSAAIAFNVIKLPYAMWFKVVMLSCFAAASYLGFTRGKRMDSLAAEGSAE